MNIPNEKTLAEIEAGRRANERHRRLDVLNRLKKTGRVTTAIAVAPDRLPVQLGPNNYYDGFLSKLYVDGVEVWAGTQHALDDPPDEVMAQLAMWQRSQGIELPAPDVAGAGQLDDGMREYHRRLHETNKNRPDFQRPKLPGR